MRVFISILVLLLCVLPSLFEKVGNEAKIKNIISSIFGISENFENICDDKEEPNWWELSWGINPEYNGIRAGKRNIFHRNITWFALTLPTIQSGITTSTLSRDPAVNTTHPGNYIYDIFGKFCNEETTPKINIQAGNYTCVVVNSLGLCPIIDDWSRQFYWFNWNGTLHSDPFGVEIKNKNFGKSYKNIVLLLVDKIQIDIYDMNSTEVGNYTNKTIGYLGLGLKLTNQIHQAILLNVTVAHNDLFLVNKALKQILRIKQIYTSFKEAATEFYEFSFGVQSQDELRREAIESKLNLKNNYPKIRKKSLLNFILTMKDLVYRGNESYNVWQTGEVERWIFVNASSPLMASDIIIEQIYIYSLNKSGYEAAKIILPFAHIAVNREWTAKTDYKVFYFNFNINALVPTMEVTYRKNIVSESLNFRIPSPNYGTNYNFTYIIDDDGSILWSVKKTNLWGLYKNPIDVISGYIRTGKYHALVAVNKKNLFDTHYTDLLLYARKLKYEFLSNYGEYIYTRFMEEIGIDELMKFVNKMKELPTLRIIWKTLEKSFKLFHPTDWKISVSSIYKLLQENSKFNDTLNEYILHFDVRTFHLSSIIN